MKRIIKLSESDLINVVKKVLEEQSSTFGVAGTGFPNYATSSEININPKNLKLGAGGKKHPEQIEDVKALQQILINKKYLVLPPNTPLGYFGNLTNNALQNYNSKNKIQVPKNTNIKGDFLDCVKNSPKIKILTLQDKSTAISIDDYIFYNKGRVKSPKNEMGNYFCYKDGVKIKYNEGETEYLETGVNTPYRKTSILSGGIAGFYRRKFPNLAQMWFTKPLTGEDFSEGQKQVIYDVIQRSIAANRIDDKNNKNTRERGCVVYKDYSDDIDRKLNTRAGASTLDSIIGSLTDVKFKVATTLGQFCYKLNSDGSYTVRDTYDFSKGGSYKATKKDLEGKTYPEQIWTVMKKSNSTPYRAAREIAYLEHPDSDPEELKTPMVVTIDAGYYAKNEKNKVKDDVA